MSLLYCELLGDKTSKAGFCNKNYPVWELLKEDKKWTPKKEKIINNNNQNNGQNIFIYRSRVIKWIYKIRQLPQLMTISHASIYNTIEIIDTFLASNFVHKTQIKLLAISALIISSKYYDDTPLEPLCMVNVCGDYPIVDILEAEHELLNFLDWQISLVTPYKYISNLDITDDIREVALIIYERFSMRKSFVDQNPANIAIVCIFFAYRLLGEISDNNYNQAFIAISLPNNSTNDWFNHLL
ncbi:Cyclin-like protein [Pacmanvirus A23]|uniref:Cyclin-like protein n=1 Tax=Pacmanvirus A23 TaxID=1932881 RepID=UPI000A095CD8|nr:Cyclin-like protein [Pacmanvirus A23]SIP85883.1 Cyclin-like protein [Pacmanvirus A23]